MFLSSTARRRRSLQELWARSVSGRCSRRGQRHCVQRPMRRSFKGEQFTRRSEFSNLSTCAYVLFDEFYHVGDSGYLVYWNRLLIQFFSINSINLCRRWIVLHRDWRLCLFLTK